MDCEIKYRGRVATQKDIVFIRAFIKENPHLSRWALSKRFCQIWGWIQPNGTLQDMICRGFLLSLDRAGYIKLPPKRSSPPNPLVLRKPPSRIQIDQTPVHAALSEVLPLEICQVRGTALEKMFNSLIDQYHYLGYCHPVGEHLKYIIFSKERPIACFAWSSAPRHIGCRDKFINWSAGARKKNLHLIAYNSRFLIFDWIRVPYLASHLLGRMAKVLPINWQRFYNHPIYFLETFVDTEKFAGTCYKAAGWQFLGLTTGRGKNDQTKKPNRSLKAVWGYPLTRDFRDRLWQ